ncbi:hypothetical protein BGW38_009876, partial [Lunasporangiospora selenospora]
RFLIDRENRKATLRIGAGGSIQARAESLQTPTKSGFCPTTTFTPPQTRRSLPIKKSFESLHVASARRATENKPPVRSLISFWEQVSDPLEA